MRGKFFHSLASLVGIVLFSGALWVLHRELSAYHFQEIIQKLHELPSRRLFAGLGLTFLSYLFMTGYDTLALRYIKHPLSYAKTAVASFIGYAFSNNMGFGMIAGSTVRYRLYSAWGLSTIEITQVITFCSLTLWMGFFTLGGMVFLFEPMEIPSALHLPFVSARLAGVVFLALVVTYFLCNIVRKQPLRFRDWEFAVPSLPLIFAQMGIAVLDWTLAGSVLYALLPPIKDLSYLGFFGIFLLAQTAGLISQVPGGLGVFETIILLLLSSRLPSSEILGALLAYRAMFYILPLLLAATLLGVQEIFQRREKFQRLAEIFVRVGSGIIPNFLAVIVFLCGAILLFSGATPEIDARLDHIKRFLPLSILETSHFLGSLAGTGLLLLARGLQRRLDAAYGFAVVLLASGIVFSLLKGLDYEESIVLAITLIMLIPCHRYFYRKSSFVGQNFGRDWITAIVIVLLCAMWLGFFSYKHVEYSRELWWRFTFSGNAPRFLRAMVGTISILLFYMAAKFLRPFRSGPARSKKDALAQALVIVRQSPNAYANLALLGDKSLLFSQNQNAFIMYATEGRSWIAMGDPVGLEEEKRELVWRFIEMCNHYDGSPAFYQVSTKYLNLYVDLGLSLLKIGEEGRVSLHGFSLEGSARKGLRYAVRKAEKAGYSFEVVRPGAVGPLLPELKVISDAWLEGKHTREKRFSLGCFSPDYLEHFSTGIIRKEKKIIAFTNIWESGQKKELSLDLMRYLPAEHYGVMDYLFIQLMLWGKQEGYQSFNLGMAPMSGLADHQLAPVWNRLEAFVFQHGEHFYNFQGLRRYKEKFGPEWESKYLASRGGLSLPRIVTNIASLVSGGLKGVIAK